MNAITAGEVEAISPHDLRNAQLEDPDYGAIFAEKAGGTVDRPVIENLSVRGRMLLDQWSLISRDEASGVFYLLKRRPHIHRVFIAPRSMVDRLFELAHTSPRAGHLGIRRTLARIQENFYWPRMKEDVTERVRRCNPCGCRKNVNLAKTPL